MCGVACFKNMLIVINRKGQKLWTRPVFESAYDSQTADIFRDARPLWTDVRTPLPPADAQVWISSDRPQPDEEQGHLKVWSLTHIYSGILLVKEWFICLEG